GNMGGGYQPIGHVSILTNIIDFGMNIQEAGDAPRWSHTGSSQPTDPADEKLTGPGQLSLESALGFDVIRELRSKGHRVQMGNSFFGRYQGIMRDHENGVWIGASESRVDGQAVGY
ncbi:MAG: gamma-glutamyltransferase, partial [Balneolaceae bacterium]